MVEYDVSFTQAGTKVTIENVAADSAQNAVMYAITEHFNARTPEEIYGIASTCSIVANKSDNSDYLHTPFSSSPEYAKTVHHLWISEAQRYLREHPGISMPPISDDELFAMLE